MIRPHPQPLSRKAGKGCCLPSPPAPLLQNGRGVLFCPRLLRAANRACGSTTSKLASSSGLWQATLSNRTHRNGWTGIAILYLMGGQTLPQPHWHFPENLL